MKKYLRYIGIWCLLAGLLVGCLGCSSFTRPSTKDNNCLTIVCTTFAGKEIAKALTQNWLELPEGHGYDALEIKLLGKGGVDPHSYEPTAADLVVLYNADIFVYLGQTAEPWAKNALAAVHAESVVFDMMEACHDHLLPSGHDSDTCTPDHHHHEHHDGGTYDEHIWTSPQNMMALTTALSLELQKLLPYAKALIVANETAYLAQLEALDKAYTDMVSNAKRKEVLVADRNPFVYLMHGYGITAHAAFPGCSSETEASFATQAKLLEIIKSQKLPYIFQTEGGESAIAKTLSDATGADILTLHACQVMTEEERWEMTYLDIMKNNLENLKKALWEDDLSLPQASRERGT